MHKSSMDLMNNLLHKYAPKLEPARQVVDVGSSTHGGGSYRKLIVDRRWDYWGIDIAEGNNVDQIVSEHGWYESDFWDVKKEADIVISGQCMEHVKWPWIWIQNVAMLVKPGGLVIIIAPREWEHHPYPIDCHRFLADGMQSYFEWTEKEHQRTGSPILKTIEVGVIKRDCFGVARRSKEG